MRHEEIRKKLIYETSIAAAIVCALAGLTYFLTTVVDDYTQQKTELEGQVAAVSNTKQTLENKYQKIQQNMDLYREVLDKNSNSGLTISRQALSAKINDFKNRYFLNELSIAMGPTQEMTGDKYRYKSNVVVGSELTVGFDALTDEDIYSIAQTMQDELPGAFKITKFTITRVSKVTDESLRAIAKNGQYSMVKGDMKVIWLGIKPVEQNTEAAGKK